MNKSCDRPGAASPALITPHAAPTNSKPSSAKNYTRPLSFLYGCSDLTLLIENIAAARSIYHLSDELAEATRK